MTFNIGQVFTNRLAQWGLVLWALGGTSAGALAATGEGLTAPRLHHAIVVHVQEALERTQVSASKIDIEIRGLSAPLEVPDNCGTTQVDTDQQRLVGHFSAHVTCSDVPTWSVRLPVHARILAPSVVAVRNLPARHRITASDVALRDSDLSLQRNDAMIDPALAIGQESRRPLRAGQSLSLSQLQPAQLVQRGDRVRLLAGSSGFAVHTLAEAMENGREGQQIRVRNITSGRVVHAWVKEAGLVSSQP